MGIWKKFLISNLLFTSPCLAFYQSRWVVNFLQNAMRYWFCKIVKCWWCENLKWLIPYKEHRRWTRGCLFAYFSRPVLSHSELGSVSRANPNQEAAYLRQHNHSLTLTNFGVRLKIKLFWEQPRCVGTMDKVVGGSTGCLKISTGFHSFCLPNPCQREAEATDSSCLLTWGNEQ